MSSLRPLLLTSVVAERLRRARPYCVLQQRCIDVPPLPQRNQIGVKLRIADQGRCLDREDAYRTGGKLIAKSRKDSSIPTPGQPYKCFISGVLVAITHSIEQGGSN